MPSSTLSGSPTLYELHTLIREKLLRERARGTQVQTQPLGFLRLALDGQRNNEPGLFLHAWLPGLPTQKGGPFYHTHVFDLTSTVIFGTIEDTTYQAVPQTDGAFRLTTALCAQDFCLPQAHGNGSVEMRVLGTATIPQGGVYSVPKGTFHSTRILGDKRALTLIEKTNIDASDPLLAIPRTISIPSESFSRGQIDQQTAWNLLLQLFEESFEYAKDKCSNVSVS